MVEAAHKRHAYHLNRLAQRDTTETTTQCSGGLLGGFQTCVTKTITHKSPTSSTPPSKPPASSPPPSTPTPHSTAGSSNPSSPPAGNNNPSLSSSSSSSPAAVPSSTSRTSAPPKSTAQPPSSSAVDPNLETPTTALVTSSSSIVVLGNSALPQSEPVFSLSSDSSLLPSGTPASVDNSGASSQHTSAVVGGIVAGIAGLAVLGLVGLYLIRRWKNRQEERDEDEIFAAQYRRQSAILVEDEFSGDASGGGMAGMIGAGGYKPRPPTMIERHLANGAGAGAVSYGHGHDQYAQHPTFPQNGMPQHFQEQSPTDQYYDTGAPGSFSVGDYATMDRNTGVTPFQAAQYAAIAEQTHAGQHHHHQGEYDQGAYYQPPPAAEQWNNGSPYEDGVHAPEPAAMAYDFPMTPTTRPSPDEIAQFNQVRAQSPPSLGKRREPTAYNVSSHAPPHRQNSTGHGY